MGRLEPSNFYKWDGMRVNYAVRAIPRLQNFDRFTVKHAFQNSQNNCHQWLSDSYKLQQIRSRLKLRPGPRWGSLQRSPDPLAGLRGPASKRGERKGRKKEGR